MKSTLIEAINADLPKGFLLREDDLQASATGLPENALREAIVNAFMHRSYREHRPTQVIRYDNRIEIINPGFSLKSEDKLGQPGSETRNPFIAAVFHETNLAETKGSGIRAMRTIMEQSHLAPPTFESSRENNEFTVRLLLHHFLNEKDIKWLKYFSEFGLNDSQKQALIFVREVGAIDNQTYRQMADCDTLRASTELRTLKSFDLLRPKGKGKATYYVPGDILMKVINMPDLIGSGVKLENPDYTITSTIELGLPPVRNSTPPPEISTPPPEISTPPPEISTPPPEISAPPPEISAPPPEISAPPLGLTTPPPEISAPPFSGKIIDDDINRDINELKLREHDPEKIRSIIKRLCKLKATKSNEIASRLKRGEKYITRKYLGPMIVNGELKYLYPEMVHHPEQAYLTNDAE